MQPNLEIPEEIVDAGIRKEINSIQQWDHLAFSVIYQELVPKGYKEIKNGKYRGSEYAEVPKKAVVRTQKIGAQLVRGFREKVNKEIEGLINVNRLAEEKALQDLGKIPFYRFKKRKLIKETILCFRQMNEAYSISLRTLYNTNIK